MLESFGSIIIQALSIQKNQRNPAFNNVSILFRNSDLIISESLRSNVACMKFTEYRKRSAQLPVFHKFHTGYTKFRVLLKSRSLPLQQSPTKAKDKGC